MMLYVAYMTTMRGMQTSPSPLRLGNYFDGRRGRTKGLLYFFAPLLEFRSFETHSLSHTNTHSCFLVGFFESLASLLYKVLARGF
jgi:hypothetical protein